MATHAGAEAMYGAIKRHFYAPNLSSHARAIASKCVTCVLVNPRRNKLPPAGQLKRGVGPFEVLQIDFTEIVKCVPGFGEE